MDNKEGYLPIRNQIHHFIDRSRNQIGFLGKSLFLLVILACIHLHAAGSYRQNKDLVLQAVDKGDSLYRCQQYVPALKEYISQLQYSRHLENDSLFLVLLSRIGSIYDNSGDFPRALYYYDKILAHPEAADYNNLKASVLVKMVVGNYNNKNLEQARYYYAQQLKHPIPDSIDNRYYILINGGLVESLGTNHKKAINYFSKALGHIRGNGMSEEYSIPVMLELADMFQKERQNDSVLLYIGKALELSDRLGLREYAADSYKALGDFYSLQGDKDKSAFYYRKYEETKKTCEDTDLDSASLMLLQSHDMQAREEIDSLNYKIDLQTIIIWITVIFCILLVVLALYMRRQHKKLKNSYLMLIKKSDQIMELEEMVAAKESSSIPYIQDMRSEASSATATTIAIPDPSKEIPDSSPSRILAGKIEEVMDDVAIISNPAFSLADLSREVCSNTKYVSTAINEVYGKNFRALLNEKRIRESLRRLSDETNYGKASIAEIAESLGYGSSTVFINAFKKEIGMTPAVYRKYKK